MAGRLTRGEVARRLGVAVASVRRFEGTKLHPVRGEDGVWLFEPAEVSALEGDRRTGGSNRSATRSVPEGDLAAAAFELFEAGRTFSAIVRELRQPPAVVRQLHREWLAGFADVDDSGFAGDEDLDAQRTRDERELLAWEKRMLDLQEREDDIDRRDRHERIASRFTPGRRVTRMD